MRKLLIIIFSVFILNTIYSQNYWQQEANYKILVDVNAKRNTFKGEQEIIYTNNSLDTIFQRFQI